MKMEDIDTVWQKRKDFIRKYNIVPNTLLVDQDTFERWKFDNTNLLQDFSDKEEVLDNKCMGMRIETVLYCKTYIKVALMVEE